MPRRPSPREITLDDWAQLVDQAVRATAASAVRRLRKSTETWGCLPIDLVNTTPSLARAKLARGGARDDEADALARVAEMTRRLAARIDSACDDALIAELCALRDVVNAS